MSQTSRSVWALVVGCAVVAAGVSAGVGCDDGGSAQSPSQTVAGTGGGDGAAEALPANLIVAAAPAGAKDVVEVRNAAEGEEVVVQGQIAGRAEPFTEGRAQFQLVDLKLKNCKEIEGDACPTPWDMCCSEGGEIAENSLTVQVVGADGKPLKAALKGVSGMQPLSKVSVRGKVQKSPDGKAVTVNATELHVQQLG